MIGRVVSVKMNKTAVVLVENRKTHPLYKKSYKHSKKYLADDQKGVALGDIVEIQKIKPVSKRKHWTVLKVVGKDVIALGTETMARVAEAAIEEVMPEEKETEVLNSEVVESVDKSEVKNEEAEKVAGAQTTKEVKPDKKIKPKKGKSK